MAPVATGSLGTERGRAKEASGPALTSTLKHCPREGADGARCYGVARHREGSRQRSIGLRRAFSPAFRAGSLDPLARGCRRIWRGVILVYWFRRRDAARPARAAWAGPRLQAARCRGRRRRRLRIRLGLIPVTPRTHLNSQAFTTRKR